MRTFFLQTFGCKLNQTDTASVRSRLRSLGLVETPDPAAADLIVVNTCSVTSRAERHARQAVRRLRRAAPRCRLVVTGCYAQLSPGKIAAMPEVDSVVGLGERDAIPDPAAGADAPPRDRTFEAEVDFGDRSRAFLKIQEGCDRRCAYCVVRLARGRPRSLGQSQVMERLAGLAAEGFGEVVLTGTHTGLWGREFGSDLCRLLRAIDGDDRLPSIRLCSLEPYEVTDELLELVAASRRIAHHLHLAVQSGSARVLAAMRRPPEPQRIAEIAERAREIMPLCGMGADVIVGFPGETDADFADTAALLTRQPFTYAHVFAFSPRPDTEAAAMPDQVHRETVTARGKTLRGLMAERNLLFRRSMVSEALRAVVLSPCEETPAGRAITDNYIHVILEGVGDLVAGAPCLVRITAAEQKSTRAVVLKNT